MERNSEYFQTKKRVREIRAFFQHLSLYLLVMALALVIDLLDGGGFWCYWPATGWGIFIIFNAFSVISHGVFERELKESRAT